MTTEEVQTDPPTHTGLVSKALEPDSVGDHGAWEALVNWHREVHGGKIDFCQEQPCHACWRARWTYPGQYR